MKDLVAEVNQFLCDAKLNKQVLDNCRDLANRLEKGAKREAAKSPQREALQRAASRVGEVANHEENDLPMLTNGGRRVLAEVATELQAASEKHEFADANQMKRWMEYAKELSESASCRVVEVEVIVSVKSGKIMVLVKYRDGDDWIPHQLYMRGASSAGALETTDNEMLALMNRQDTTCGCPAVNDEGDVLLSWLLYHVK